MLKFINQKYTNLDVSQFISMIKSSTDTVYKSFGNTDRDKEIYGVVEVNYFRIKIKKLWPFIIEGKGEADILSISGGLNTFVFLFTALLAIYLVSPIFSMGRVKFSDIVANSLLFIFITYLFTVKYIQLYKT